MRDEATPGVSRLRTQHRATAGVGDNLHEAAAHSGEALVPPARGRARRGSGDAALLRWCLIVLAVLVAAQLVRLALIARHRRQAAALWPAVDQRRGAWEAARAWVNRHWSSSRPKSGAAGAGASGAGAAPQTTAPLVARHTLQKYSGQRQGQFDHVPGPGPQSTAQACRHSNGPKLVVDSTGKPQAPPHSIQSHQCIRLW